ncbi:MAG: hypothetical protein KatS3mg105_3581 [Gemmatales bacterium]|nr:MAG: hypothetical protein KatS3mg105_3581 [Gemmatales bacterium]
MVDPDFQNLLAEVDWECRRRSIPMIGPHKARKLAEWIGEARPNLVVEVGTAIGYSGLWIADTLRRLSQGRLITLEQDEQRALEAQRYFERAGLADRITIMVGDAREKIALVRGPIDVLFLDGGFANYYPCFERARPQLANGAWLIADNVAIGAAEMSDYLDWVRRHCPSRTEWFDTDLQWVQRDAMEVSIYQTRTGA